MTLHIPPIEPEADPLAAALLYAKAGWYVVPIRRGTKNPGSVLGKSWPTQSTRDPETIVSWWAGTDHGIAIHVGRSGAVVLDVDTPDKLTADLAELLYASAAPFQSTQPNTPGRGHYLFLTPTGRLLGNSLGTLPKGWGDVRGANGVIVVAPSEHPDGGEYAWVHTTVVPPLPTWIADALPDAHDAVDSVSDEQIAAFIDQHAAESRPQLLRGWLAGFRRDVDAGYSRHGSMVTRLAGAMKEARAGYFTAEAAYYQLQDVFVEAVTQDGHGQQGGKRSINSARAEFHAIASWAIAQAYAADLTEVEQRVTEKSSTVDATEAMFDLENLAQAEVVPGKDEPGEVVSADLYLSRSALDKMPQGVPLIERVIDRHTVTVISGRDQTYKSFFLLDMMLCLATGTPFHGQAVERTPVLMVVGEGAWGLGKRVAAWESHYGVQVEDEWFHVRRLPVNLFTGALSVGELVERTATYGYGLVAFDTLQRNTAGADANSAKDAGMIYRSLDGVRNATDNGSVLFVAHTGKDDKDVRGSSAFEDDADIVWTARKQDDDSVKFTQTKRKDGPDGKQFHLAPRINADVQSLVLVPPGALTGVARGTSAPRWATEAMEALATPLFADGTSINKLQEHIGAPAGSGLSRAINWLIDQDMVVLTKVGQRSIVRAVR